MNNQVSKDGMRYPSVDQLSSKSSSKYKLVVAVAARAHQIDATKKVYLENTHNSKSIGIALEEILEDKIKIK